ncbi:major facilitator superfamily protein, putative [Ichthyophthirius multifiliis]|uniref:Major facilitator superfamily protein, putative n=1 Tax=Ichthyophthirius multifiliis TaxID=5932 RepID=G0QTJ7_ICHMU|nr:major facilitator superfamily protein, putative [Ichthyophthirius multifiliis]EGR31448.1 major facilitator superfamily protein, putative [Ichthyophthirius multifiliis]|eukprot:XP_004034934.1 major facilitator superfamily protein, putative [Ichthyophthirius multifiliis]
MGSSFLYLGPDSFLLGKDMNVVIIANIFVGIAYILIYIPAIPQLYRILKCIYPEENDNMIGDISSALYNTSYALGEFIGPLVGGFFSEFFSFSRAASIFGVGQVEGKFIR